MRGQPVQDHLLLRSSQPLARDRLVEPGLHLCQDRRLQARSRLAVGDGDLRQRLARPELGAELHRRDVQVGRDSSAEARAAQTRPRLRRLRVGVVDEVVEPALQPGEECLLLRLRQPAVVDRPVEVGLEVGIDCLLEPGDGLALRDGDLRERLAGGELLAQLRGRKAEVRSDCGRPWTARRASRVLAAGGERAAGACRNGEGCARGGEQLLRTCMHGHRPFRKVARIVPAVGEKRLRKT
jgi:hypothetical protein